MKRYIRSNAVIDVNITDLFSGISKIIIVEDASEYSSSKIMASDDISYRDYSDEHLMDIDDNEMSEIRDVITIERISKIAPERLTSVQRELLKSELETKYIIDADDVDTIISDLAACNTVKVEERDDNDEFLDGFVMREDVLPIIHSLKLSDYICSTKSKNSHHLGNDIVIFMPKLDIGKNTGMIYPDMYVYVKIDLTATFHGRRRAIAVISFHDAKNPPTYIPYKNK